MKTMYLYIEKDKTYSMLTILLFGMLLLSCNQEDKKATDAIQNSIPSITIHKDSLELIPNKGLVYYQQKPFTGISIAIHPNQEKAKQITYVNGKKNGLETIWYEDGIKSYECNYVNGRREGKSFTWWRNGKRRSESNFENGISNGIQKQWYVSGVKFKKMNLVDGREEGMQQSWRENGKLYNNYEAKNGRIFGLKKATLCYELEDEEVQYKE